MSYEYQITIGSEEIYFEVEHDPEDLLTFNWCEHPDTSDID